MRLGNCEESVYFLVGSGNLCIDGDGETIQNSAECRVATNRLGKVFNSEADTASYPSGCFVFWDTSTGIGSNVFFNHNPSGARNVRANPICKESNAGKTL